MINLRRSSSFVIRSLPKWRISFRVSIWNEYNYSKEIRKDFNKDWNWLLKFFESEWSNPKEKKGDFSMLKRGGVWMKINLWREERWNIWIIEKRVRRDIFPIERNYIKEFHKEEKHWKTSFETENERFCSRRSIRRKKKTLQNIFLLTRNEPLLIMKMKFIKKSSFETSWFKWVYEREKSFLNKRDSHASNKFLFSRAFAISEKKWIFWD
jgi:hypothetical protein